MVYTVTMTKKTEAGDAPRKILQVIKNDPSYVQYTPPAAQHPLSTIWSDCESSFHFNRHMEFNQLSDKEVRERTELVTDYRQVCAENGITPVVSSTLTSQFNGLVESRHNQIRQMASAMLYNAVLGHEFWGLAWEHASSFGFASCGSERNGHTKEVNRCCREPSRTQVYLLLLTSLLKQLPGQQELVRITFEMRSSTSFT